MVILGIDPGFAIVGFGVLEAERGTTRLIRCGTITTPAGQPLPARLLQISNDMSELLTVFQPDAMAVEELYFNNNVTTGISVAQARGVILTEAERQAVPIFEYSPSEVKLAVAGYGKAAGYGDDQAASGTPRCSAAGRRGGRSGHRPVPRPLPYLPPAKPRSCPAGQWAL